MRVAMVVILSVGLLWTGSVSAALVNMDWHSPGDSLITLDTNTNLEWLDSSATQYISYNQMASQLGVGQAFEGWRYATPAEFQNLLDSYAPSGFGMDIYAAGLLNIMDHVGMSYTIGLPGSSFYRRALDGLFDIPFGLGRQIGGINIDMNGEYYTYVAGSSLWGSTVDDFGSDAGHWLVRAAPEPSTLGLLVIGGIFAMKRRAR